MQKQAAPAAPAPSNYRWVILVSTFVGLAFAYGLLYSFGVFLKPLQEDLGWTRDMVSWVPSLFMLFLCLTGPVAGWVADKYGPRLLVALGGTLIGLGLILASRVSTPWHLYIYYSVFVGVGVGCCASSLMPTAMRWFPKNIGTVAGVTACGSSVGTMIMAPVATRAISAYGWRTSCLVIGCCAAILIVVAFVLRKPGAQASGPAAARNMPQMTGLTLKQALRTRPMWLLLAIFVLAYGAFMMVQYHLSPHAQDIGQSKTLAAALLSVIAGVGIAGRLLGGTSSDKLGKRAVLGFALALQAVTLALLPSATSGWSLYAFSAAWGLGYGLWTPLTASIVGETFGLKYMASILGVVGMEYGIGGTIGPSLAGYIFTSSGSYNLAFYLGAAAMGLAAVLMVFVKPVKIEAFEKRPAPAAALPESA